MVTSGAGRRRARPARDDAAARSRILDAAEELFGQRGYASTPTKAIANRADVAEGLVFYHFPTKQRLLESLLAERGFAPQLRAFLAETDAEDVVGTLTAVGNRFVEHLRERKSIARILVQTSPTESEVLARFQNVLRSEIAALADYLLAAAPPHQLDGRRARAMAQSFLGTIVFSELVLPPIDADGFIDDLVAALVTGGIGT